MKKFKFYIAGWIVLVVLFNIIAFVTPAEIRNEGMFWSAYVCLMLSCLIQLGCTYYAFNNADTANKLFLNLPIITISYTGMLITVLFGIIAIAVPSIPTWIGIVVAALMLALVALSVIKAAAAAEIVESSEKKRKSQTLYIKGLTADALTLLETAENDEDKAIANKVYEAIRFSDPISSDALSNTESQITIQFAMFSDAIKNKSGEATQLGDDLLVLINDRNNKCKLLK